MTTYDDNLLAARFATLAPEPLAGDWNDVLRSAGMAPASRRRSRGLSGRRRRFLVVLAAMALVAALGTATALGVRALILRGGYIGLPPEGATPSGPETGELVLRYKGLSATVGGEGWVWVYADGRILSTGIRSSSVPGGANKLSSGVSERRLTPEGVELLRSELVATGLFDRRGLSLLFDPHAGVAYWGGVTLRRGGRLVSLDWGCSSPRCEGATATREQLLKIRRVDALVTDPASVLPSSAWVVREVRPYVPSHYNVCMTTSPPKDASELLSLLPAPAADVLRGKSLSRSEGDIVEAREAGIVVLGRAVNYCAKLTTEEAREVAEPLSGFAPDLRFYGEAALAYQLAEAVDNLDPTSISFDPDLPDGGFSAGG